MAKRLTWIPMEDGVRLAASLYLPEAAESGEPVPVVLEALPYRKDDATASYRPEYERLCGEYGYAVARVDLRGTGSSEGLATDEYPPSEQADLCQVIDWLARQPWSSGSVGMYGTSYSGFNSLQVAAERPPALKAVIAIYASDDRYTDDVHYTGGALKLLDLVDYPLYMVALNALPPVPAIAGPDWRERWRERVEALEPWLLRWVEEQVDGPYWRQGSLRPAYERIACPTMIVAGWADGYRNATFRLLEQLQAPTRLLFGPWSHMAADSSLPGPRIDLVPEMVRWWDRWLRGHRNGVDEGPPVTVFARYSTRPAPDTHPGAWHAEPTWPPARATALTLPLATGSDEPGAGHPGGADSGVATGRVDRLEVRPDVGSAAWISCAGQLPFGQPVDQREDDAWSLRYEWPLEQELEVLGHPRLVVRVGASAPVAFLSAKLCDVFPDGTSTLVARGFLNLTQRRSRTDPEPLRPDVVEPVELELDATSWVFPPGHRLRLSLAGTDWPNIVPPPGPVTLLVEPDGSALTLPVLNGPSPAPPPNLSPPRPPEPTSAPPGPTDAPLTPPAPSRSASTWRSRRAPTSAGPGPGNAASSATSPDWTGPRHLACPGRDRPARRPPDPAHLPRDPDSPRAPALPHPGRCCRMIRRLTGCSVSVHDHGMRQGRFRLVTALLAAAAATVGFVPGVAVAQEEDGRELGVGRLRLLPCEDVDGAWCGSLRVPFDRADPAAGTIRINFEWYPAEQAPVGTIVAMEGGPGYPSTGSRDSYLELFGLLQTNRNLLLVDNRGTGTSGLFNCTPLQRWHLALGNDEYIRRVAQCGDQLNSSRRRPGDGFVHGSDLYGTANAARDLADVLAALETGPVDLYGDSYGSYFGQVFAARYPRLLRSLTLDATWPVLGTDPFHISTIETARIAFDLACRRSVACALAAPGSSMARIGALAERLRRAPVVGQTREPGGAPSTWRVDVGVLVALVNNAGSDAGVYRELDAAARAVLQHRDGAPLLRLAAKSLYTEDGGPVREWAAGQYVAVSCTDYPQAFDMHAPPAVRRDQYRAALDALPDDVFAPFSVREWATSPVGEFDACLDWPAPVRDDPPIATAPAPVPPDLPVLVLSGGLDTLTPWTDGAIVAEQLGPSARWVKVENTVHVTALGDLYGCASGLVRRFVRHPGQLQTMDASCAARIPEVRAVGQFPRRLVGATPARPRPGNRAGPGGLRLAAVAAAAVGDAVAQWWYLPGSRGHGLRGGWFTVDGDEAVTLDLHKVRFVADATVDGRATWNTTTGQVAARVVVKGPRGISATVRMRWDDLARRPRATVSGRTGSGSRLLGSLPAP